MTAVEELSLGGVGTGEFLLLQTDQPIKVGIDNQTVLLDVSKAIMLGGASFTHIYLQNESTTNTATVQAVVTD